MVCRLFGFRLLIKSKLTNYERILRDNIQWTVITIRIILMKCIWKCCLRNITQCVHPQWWHTHGLLFHIQVWLNRLRLRHIALVKQSTRTCQSWMTGFINFLVFTSHVLLHYMVGVKCNNYGLWCLYEIVGYGYFSAMLPMTLFATSKCNINTNKVNNIWARFFLHGIMVIISSLINVFEWFIYRYMYIHI